jgi:hypothetical protein
MDRLFELIGLALPNTPKLLRLKCLCGGLCGVGAGLLYMTSGLADALVWGGLMMACGIAVFGLVVRSFVREARRKDGPGRTDKRN